MWEQEEFAKHWRNEFPGGDVPQMNLKSAADIESELEACKGKLKRLQRALAEEKFKVIYLQTAMARRQRGDPERLAAKDENFNAPHATPSAAEVRKAQRPDEGRDRHRTTGPDPAGAKLHAAGVTGSFTPERGRFSGRMGKPVPIPVPPRMLSFHRAEPNPTKTDSEPGSDREYEDAELNENCVRNNLLTPKPVARDTRRSPSSHRDARRPFTHSRDLDSGDDGRLSPSFPQVHRRASRGSGCSTPDRRSDGYLSSDHEDSSSAGNGTSTPVLEQKGNGTGPIRGQGTLSATLGPPEHLLSAPFSSLQHPAE